jgi:hypothetical protein
MSARLRHYVACINMRATHAIPPWKPHGRFKIMR